jgi:hypothetical protein
MRRIDLTLSVIITISFAALLSISNTATIALGAVSTSGTQSLSESHELSNLYSGPRASIAVSGNNIYLTWWDNSTGNNEVFSAASNDGGKTFDKEINLSNAKGGSADSQISAQGNNVYVTWWDNKTGDWQVFSRVSNDNGKKFGDAVIVKSIGNSPVKTLKAPPSDTISVDTVVASSGNNEYAVWWDNTTGNWEVSFATSSDGGKTFGDSINISNSSDARSVGARIATEGNNVYIAWIDIDENSGQKQVILRASNDSGQTFEKPITVSSNSK